MARYLNPGDHNPRRITKTDQPFAKRLDFKDIKFPVKTRDIRKIKKKKNPSALVMKIRKNVQFMYQNNIVKKNMLA